jgi:hypothetical protein
MSLCSKPLESLNATENVKAPEAAGSARSKSFFMSLRCRYAPAYGSKVVSFRPVYPALIPQCGFSSKSSHLGNGTGLGLCHAFGALCTSAHPRLSPALPYPEAEESVLNRRAQDELRG